VSVVLQRLEREIADFSKDHDKRVKAATAKLKAAKQVRSFVSPLCSCQLVAAIAAAGHAIMSAVFQLPLIQQRSSRQQSRSSAQFQHAAAAQSVEEASASSSSACH
jgi:hypothetical protein